MFSSIQRQSRLFQVIWIERLNYTRLVAVAYNRAIISILPRIICGKSQKKNFSQSDRSADWIMNLGPLEKKSGNIKFCENYWKHTAWKWQYIIRGYFKREGNVILCSTLQQFFIFPPVEIKQNNNRTSGVCSTFTEQFCGNHTEICWHGPIYWSLQFNTQTTVVLLIDPSLVKNVSLRG